MKGLVLLKKELREGLRTPKAVVLTLIFLFFGILNPITARYINEIISSAGGIEGFRLPDPTWIDAFMQFYKNSQSICFLALILTFMGTVVNEKRSGTMVLMLSKGAKRGTFIYAKFSAAAIFYTIAYVIGASVTVLYTYLLFDNVNPDKLTLALLVYWLTGLFYIAVAMLASVLAKTVTSAAIISLAGYFLVSAMGAIPQIKKFTPSFLTETSSSLLTGKGWPDGAYLNISVVILMIIILLKTSVIVLKRQEM